MPGFRRPALRWAAPAAAVALIAAVGVGAAAAASADDRPDLPPRTAEQLLADLAQPTTVTISGTVALHADLGLPEIPGLGGGVRGSGVVPDDAASVAPEATQATAADPVVATVLGLAAGDHTLRVWADGPERHRVAILADGAETDLVRNGTDAWLWQSDGQRAVHATLPQRPAHDESTPPGLDGLELFGTPLDLADVPATPQEAAAALLAAAGPTTDITSGDTTRVAGRDAYQLVATPTVPDTLVARVAVAIDAETHVPLRLEVYSTQRAEPALAVGFTDVSYATPSADVFAFAPPAGATVTEVPGDAADGAKETPPPGAGTPGTGPGRHGDRPDVTTVGEGWATVVVVTPAAGAGSSSAALDGTPLDALSPVSGPWGSGHALAGTLFSVLLADDGRVAAGAVPVSALEDALARAGS